MDHMANRPEIAFDARHVVQEDERFMHACLRPILKQQNALLNHLSIASCLAADEDFFRHALEDKQRFMRAQLEKNAALKNQLIGIVIGGFTKEEMGYYLSASKRLNKRISQMIQVRVLDQMNFFLMDFRSE